VRGRGVLEALRAVQKLPGLEAQRGHVAIRVRAPQFEDEQVCRREKQVAAPGALRRIGVVVDEVVQPYDRAEEPNLITLGCDELGEPDPDQTD